MADATVKSRPLSPHLQAYRMYITMVVSGLHRITGFGMIVSAILVVWWFIAAAASPEYFALVDGLLTSWIGTLVMVASLYGLCHHFLNGIRHLIWDTGRMLDKEAVNSSAWFVLVGAPALAILVLLIVVLG
ncbi:MAG: succinate dehydrogenase, cytochrome b556 subunit [Paracoccaceae bacterium]